MPQVVGKAAVWGGVRRGGGEVQRAVAVACWLRRASGEASTRRSSSLLSRHAHALISGSLRRRLARWSVVFAPRRERRTSRGSWPHRSVGSQDNSETCDV